MHKRLTFCCKNDNILMRESAKLIDKILCVTSWLSYASQYPN